MHEMNRACQIMLILATIGFSWLAMQAVHEAGHVLGAIATGGKISRVILDPLAFSRTDLSKNPHPLFTTWAGPVFGVALPLLTWIVARYFRAPAIYLYRFFAGFCLVANGTYIGLGSIPKIADAGDLLRHGAARWQLISFGLVCISLGLYLWNGLGLNFGLGKLHHPVSRQVAIIMMTLFLLITSAELIWGREQLP